MINSPKELSEELRSLLSYAEGVKPSRQKIATALQKLAESVAATQDDGPVSLVAVQKFIADRGLYYRGVSFDIELDFLSDHHLIYDLGQNVPTAYIDVRSEVMKAAKLLAKAIRDEFGAAVRVEVEDSGGFGTRRNVVLDIKLR